jgi:hypothetical protein
MPSAEMPENTWHVLPQNDLVPHDESTRCVCGPRIEWTDNGAVVVHHAWDERERTENEEVIRA